jgi:MoxR-like ATPase
MSVSMSQTIGYQYLGGRDGREDECTELQPPYQNFIDPFDRSYDPYWPEAELVEAVNLAIDLNMPLLLEGEPGCGKTRLAGAIAYEFTQRHLPGKIIQEEGKVLGQEWWPYYVWNVKSIGRAKDGLYEFDAVLRLRDAQIFGTDPVKMKDYLGDTESEAIKARLLDKSKYVNYGPLGKAFQEPFYRPVILIDEIDKADSDFPNDLLFELDRMGFEVPEAGIPFKKAVHNPIIIITSNRERPLPEAFLRRCLYFCLDFPQENQLRDILNRRFSAQLMGQPELVDQAIAKFLEMRVTLKGMPGSKPPGTSEILRFMEMLLRQSKDRAQEILNTLEKQSPFLGILLKTQQDQARYLKSNSGRQS